MTSHKTIFMAVASAASLAVAAPGWADNHGKASAEANTSAEMEANTQITADTLIGKGVRNAKGESFGDIESVIIDESGRVAAVVVGVGGFLGMGEHEVTIDWRNLDIRDNGRIIRTSLTKQQVKDKPAYEYQDSNWRNTAFVDSAYLEKRRETAGLTGAAAVKAGQMTERQPADMTKQDDMSNQVADTGNWVDANRLRFSDLDGSTVVNANGAAIGEIDDILYADGKVTLVVSAGEFLGIGGTQVLLDLDQAEIKRQQDSMMTDLRVSTSMSQEEIKALPKYDPESWSP